MSLGTILLIVLVLILLGIVPTWPHSRGWGTHRYHRSDIGGVTHTAPDGPYLTRACDTRRVVRSNRAERWLAFSRQFSLAIVDPVYSSAPTAMIALCVNVGRR